MWANNVDEIDSWSMISQGSSFVFLPKKRERESSLFLSL